MSGDLAGRYREELLSLRLMLQGRLDGLGAVRSATELTELLKGVAALVRRVEGYRDSWRAACIRFGGDEIDGDECPFHMRDFRRDACRACRRIAA